VVRLNEPQDALPQFAVHLTWGFAVTSFANLAFIGATALICSEAGMAGRNFTLIGMGGTLVIVVDLDKFGRQSMWL
jgi:hypothetical protein